MAMVGMKWRSQASVGMVAATRTQVTGMQHLTLPGRVSQEVMGTIGKELLRAMERRLGRLRQASDILLEPSGQEA